MRFCGVKRHLAFKDASEIAAISSFSAVSQSLSVSIDFHSKSDEQDVPYIVKRLVLCLQNVEQSVELAVVESMCVVDQIEEIERSGAVIP